MPTYDYRCNACEHAFEQFQSITAKPIRKCPACGKNSAKRLISAGAGIIFKGSGFYQTDYRSESYKAAAKADAEKSGGKSTETKAESKAESKVESKTESKSDSKPKSQAESKADSNPAKSGGEKS